MIFFHFSLFEREREESKREREEGESRERERFTLGIIRRRARCLRPPVGERERERENEIKKMQKKRNFQRLKKKELNFRVASFFAEASLNSIASSSSSSLFSFSSS